MKKADYIIFDFGSRYLPPKPQNVILGHFWGISLNFRSYLGYLFNFGNSKKVSFDFECPHMMLPKTLATAVADLLYELKEIDEKISNDDTQIECFKSN